MGKRIITSIFGAIIFLGAVLVGGIFFQGIIAITSAIALRELRRALNLSELNTLHLGLIASLFLGCTQLIS